MSARPKRPVRRKVGRPGDGVDLRGAILDATLGLLVTTGSPDRVTIATIVGEVRCTPPSLYHYWPKRELLLQEASAQGWAQFRTSQSGAVGREPDPIERLRQRGKAYLDFALARPALFRVLFLEPPVASPSEFFAEPGEALNELVSDVTAAMALGRLRRAEPFTIALALWSAIHGVASLSAVTPNLPPELARAVAELAQEALLAGLAA